MTNGVNLQPSYYNGGNVNLGWSLMKGYPKIGTVRIEVEPNVPINQVSSWITQARTQGYKIILTYHKWTSLGSNEPNELLAAGQWWKTHYATLAQAGDFTVNLSNEWGDHKITAADFAGAYNGAIALVREGAYKGKIIIDAPGWGQETLTLKNAVSQITDGDIALSVHVYPSGWNQGRKHTLQAADLDDLVSTGKPCLVGEFGNGVSGNADWSAIVTRAKALGWPVLGWAWNGDGETMNMLSPSWKAEPTSSSFTPSSYFNTIYEKL